MACKRWGFWFWWAVRSGFSGWCPDVTPFTSQIDSAVPDASNPSARPESPQYQRLWCLSLDRLGLNQAIGGFVLGLIALFSSYDHITLAGQSISLQQQGGIPCIAASVATIFTGCVQYGAPLGRDAELASRSRLRAAIELEVERDRAAVDEVGRRPWRENARLAKLNARDDALSALIKQHCFPAESNTTPIPPIEPDSSSC